MDREDWVDQEALEKYILNCQDEEDGGISDRPGNQVDVFHLVDSAILLLAADFNDVIFGQLKAVDYGQTQRQTQLSLVSINIIITLDFQRFC